MLSDFLEGFSLVSWLYHRYYYRSTWNHGGYHGIFSSSWRFTTHQLQHRSRVTLPKTHRKHPVKMRPKDPKKMKVAVVWPPFCSAKFAVCLFVDSQDGDFGIRIESDILATVAETPYKTLSFGKRGWEMMFGCCEMLHFLDVSVIVRIHDDPFGKKMLWLQLAANIMGRFSMFF